MQRVKKKEEILSPLVPKNHFCSMSLFREDPLVNWNFTGAVLFTAYDILRSSDFWLDSVISSGLTLKEAMARLGFPKETKLLADTGVFEFEAKKAGLANKLGVSLEVELTNDQILEAYELSGADYFVAPDEIILPTDTPNQVRRKVARIKENLESILSAISPDRVIAVLQGCDKNTIDVLFDYFLENGIRLFARGGLIPLWKHDNGLFCRVLKYTRELTNEYWLHCFGLPKISLLPYYLNEIGMDSVDSSMLSYMTARRRYLLGVNPRPVRLADFSACNCEGCRRLLEEPHPQSSDFFVGLYLHNVIEASGLTSADRVDASNRIQEERKALDRHKHVHRDLPRRQKGNSEPETWGTAYEKYRHRTDSS